MCREPVLPMFTRAVLQMLLTRATAQYGLQILEYSQGTAEYSDAEQWILSQSCEVDGCTLWAHYVNRRKCSFGCPNFKRRFAFATLMAVQLACHLLDWSSTALIWMLRAHCGGDSVRHRAFRPESVETTARKAVCGPPNSAQE